MISIIFKRFVLTIKRLCYTIVVQEETKGQNGMRSECKLPGTAIPRENAKDAMEILDGLFLGGGLVLSPVTELAGIEGYMVQNWYGAAISRPRGTSATPSGSSAGSY